MAHHRLGLARQPGSGSAARSVFGGLVEMKVGSRRDGEDAFAVPLLDPGSWPLRIVVAITSDEQKRIGSTEAMERTAATSRYYPSWVSSSADDLDAARTAVERRDLELLGTVA